ASASLAPRHPGRRRETAALLHRGVKQAHTTVRSGGWDSIRIDQRPIWGGVRKVRHAVVAYALGKLQGRLLLLGTPLGAHEPWRLQVLTRADGLLERRGVRIQRRAVYHPIDGERAGRVRVGELADPVGAHALGELHRLRKIGGGVVAAGAGR